MRCIQFLEQEFLSQIHFLHAFFVFFQPIPWNLAFVDHLQVITKGRPTLEFSELVDHQLKKTCKKWTGKKNLLFLFQGLYSTSNRNSMDIQDFDLDFVFAQSNIHVAPI